MRTRCLFVFIGADPNTAWLNTHVALDDHGFILTGNDIKPDQLKEWPLAREPYLLEASVPGVFAAGDVRHESIKRVASAVGEGSVAVHFVHRYLAALMIGEFLASSATPPFLVEGAALLVAAAVIAYICYRIGLVPIIGFLVAGVVIGPYGLGIVANRELVDAVAEIGVILLLFTIGLEFSLERLAKIFTLILGGGSLQVGLASVVTMGVLMALGVDWRPALFTGFLVALSSTAIVLKLFADRGETNTHARPGRAGPADLPGSRGDRDGAASCRCSASAWRARRRCRRRYGAVAAVGRRQ